MRKSTEVPSRSFKAILAPLAAIVMGLSSVVAAAPEPDPVPRRWQLDVRPGKLHVRTVEVDGTPRVYAYMTYKATNNSGEDLLFAPSFFLATDEGDVLRSGRGVPLAVTDHLIALHQNPFLMDQIRIIDEMLQGPENAVEGIVIWPLADLDIDELVVYGAGFSGETKTVIRPDNGEKVVVRKTLMMRHKIPGTLEGWGSKPIPVSEKRWIMR